MARVIDEQELLANTTAYRQGRVDMRNGSGGEWTRWALPLLLAALVSYFTTISTINVKVVTLETKQQVQFEEIQRSLSEIKQDIRELRRGGGQ